VHPFKYIPCTSPLHALHWCTLCTRLAPETVIGNLWIPRPRDSRKTLLESAILRRSARLFVDRELEAGVLVHRCFIDPIDSRLAPGRNSFRKLRENSALAQGAKDVLDFALAQLGIGGVSADGGSAGRAVAAVPAHGIQNEQLKRFEPVPP